MLLSHKKEQNNATCSNMDGPRDCHTERSKSDREGEISYPLYVATHSSILAWRIPIDRGTWMATVHRVAQSWTQLRDLA